MLDWDRNAYLFDCFLNFSFTVFTEAIYDGGCKAFQILIMRGKYGLSYTSYFCHLDVYNKLGWNVDSMLEVVSLRPMLLLLSLLLQFT